MRKVAVLRGNEQLGSHITHFGSFSKRGVLKWIP
jgi:hypothetical protein